MTEYYQRVQQVAKELATLLPSSLEWAVIVGSGLDEIMVGEEVATIPYHAVPELIQPQVVSHAGVFSVRKLGSQLVLFCRGRVHLYEGYTAREVAFLSYCLAGIGIKNLVISNAAGALNPDYRPTDSMLIKDHINFTGHNPVVGQDDQLGPRFTDMSAAYDAALCKKFSQAAQDLSISLQEGIYAGVLGPTLETSAERRMLRRLGGDAVGMSTIMEVIAANHSGMKVVGLSAITNMATGSDDQQADTVEAILDNANTAALSIRRLLTKVLS